MELGAGGGRERKGRKANDPFSIGDGDEERKKKKGGRGEPCGFRSPRPRRKERALSSAFSLS